MSFAAGIGVGIACGVAMGLSTGRKQTCEQLQEYVESNSIHIHESTGDEVDIETLCSRAVTDRSANSESKMRLGILLLFGLFALGIVAYLMLR